VEQGEGERGNPLRRLSEEPPGSHRCSLRRRVGRGVRGGGSWAELVLVVAWLAASHCQPSTVDRSASACAGYPALHQEHTARFSPDTIGALATACPSSLGGRAGALQLRGGAGLKRGVVINFLNGEKVDVSDDDVDSNDDWTGAS
jgi:hypothetical protein